MVVTKRSLAIFAAAAGAVLWVEHANRIKIETPTSVEAAERTTAVCPENESVPFSAACMLFIQGGLGANAPRLNALDGMSADSPELP
jgi:hypothetical protein